MDIFSKIITDIKWSNINLYVNTYEGIYDSLDCLTVIVWKCDLGYPGRAQLREEIISELPLGYDQEKPLPEFTARLYREQIVAGTNFFVKVETGPLRFIHVRIHADLTGEAHVVEVQIGKTMGDPLEYF